TVQNWLPSPGLFAQLRGFLLSKGQGKDTPKEGKKTGVAVSYVTTNRDRHSDRFQKNQSSAYTHTQLKG
ncbi:hypothetical protein ACPB1P_22525, partial [Escherichia coli]|uniref:hypothetical protein n=1 Tax=Escherichia coli TaxID=562 RepID=UPI003C2DF805